METKGLDISYGFSLILAKLLHGSKPRESAVSYLHIFSYLIICRLNKFRFGGAVANDAVIHSILIHYIEKIRKFSCVHRVHVKVIICRIFCQLRNVIRIHVAVCVNNLIFSVYHCSLFSCISYLCFNPRTLHPAPGHSDSCQTYPHALPE